MNESWKPVRETVQNEYFEASEGERFNAPSTIPAKSLEQGRPPTRPDLRVVKETSSGGFGSAEYSARKNLDLGVETERQRNGLRNAIYAEILAAQLSGPSDENEWKGPLDQILRVVETTPVTAVEGRVYVSGDGEVGIVWEAGSVHVEVSAGVSEYVEYLVLNDDDGVREESIWMIESGDPVPATLSSALRRRV